MSFLIFIYIHFMCLHTGCKIKALRAKTNTYIKTPVRGEEPVFVVTGRKEDVGAAKREILSAAEHFSQIRASRRSGVIGSAGQSLTGTTGLVPPPPVPGQITIQVRPTRQFRFNLKIATLKYSNFNFIHSNFKFKKIKF